MKTAKAIALATVTAMTAGLVGTAAIGAFNPDTCQAGGGRCGECRTGAGTKGFFYTDINGARCVQCDGRI